MTKPILGKDMAKRYEIGRRIDSKERTFFAKVYIVLNEKEVGKFDDDSLKGLVKKVSKKFPLTLEVDEVKSISDNSIKQDVGRFQVSNQELIDFYEMLKENKSDQKKY